MFISSFCEILKIEYSTRWHFDLKHDLIQGFTEKKSNNTENWSNELEIYCLDFTHWFRKGWS